MTVITPTSRRQKGSNCLRRSAKNSRTGKYNFQKSRTEANKKKRIIREYIKSATVSTMLDLNGNVLQMEKPFVGRNGSYSAPGYKITGTYPDIVVTKL